MSGGSLKLTAYFGERQRTEGQFFADALLDLCGQHEIATSMLMRGAEGFGLKHHLRTDRLLSLSEDLPLVTVAVDRRPRVEALLQDLRRIDHRGMVTVERIRMLRGDLGGRRVQLPDELHAATKLTVYVGRQERAHGTPAYRAVCDLLFRRGIFGATALLGVDGTTHGRRVRARFFSRNTDAPIMIVAVGTGPRIARVLPELGELLGRPLVTLERVQVCKQRGQLAARPPALPDADDHGRPLWQKLMVFTSESATRDGQPIHRTLVRRLRQTGAHGATAIRGIWGFHGERPPHGDQLLQLGRMVPVVTAVIDTPRQIARSFEVVDELTTEHGIVTSEMVPAVRIVTESEREGSLRLARHTF